MSETEMLLEDSMPFNNFTPAMIWGMPMIAPTIVNELKTPPIIVKIAIKDAQPDKGLTWLEVEVYV